MLGSNDEALSRTEIRDREGILLGKENTRKGKKPTSLSTIQGDLGGTFAFSCTRRILVQSSY